MANAAALLIGIAMALLSVEILARAMSPAVGFLDFRNFAADPVNLVRQHHLLVFDDKVGWLPRPGLRSPNDSFGVLSERLTAAVAADAVSVAPPTGAIAAFGDSFTYGSEVTAEQAWPALLAALLDRDVVNLGVGGFGIDQAVLNVERTIDALRPSVVVFSFIPPGIDRAQMSVYSGAAKPLFAIDRAGALELAAPRVVPYRSSTEHVGWLRTVFGYFYAVDFAAARLGMEGRWRVSTYEYVRPHADGLRVSCLLMPRIAARLRAHAARGIVLAQYGWNHMDPAGASEVAQSRSVLDCATRAGLETVDTLDALIEARIAEGGGIAGLRFLFNGGYGHMTPMGNALVARLIAEKIGPEPSK